MLKKQQNKKRYVKNTKEISNGWIKRIRIKNTDHTLEEVGLQFSVTRERIRQIEAKALRKLKHPSRSKQLKSFLES